MRTGLCLIVAAATLWGVRVQAQGSLTPPGAPAPTMNTLAEIYDRLTNTLVEVQASRQAWQDAQQALADMRQKVADMQQRMVTAQMLPASGDTVLIPAGGFMMGANTNVAQDFWMGELPQHAVTVSGFHMDKFEVASNLWQDVRVWAIGKGYTFTNAGAAKGVGHPVQAVSWYDCLAWCNARSQRDGFVPCYTNADGSVYTNSTVAFSGDCNWNADGYRLPTEAEWEKAARGGIANRRFPWDDANTIQHARANYQALMDVSYDTSPTPGFHPSFASGSMPYTSPVGTFAPNGYGLYDMAGNVWEWCWDKYSFTYYAGSPSSDPHGPAAVDNYRVTRGGSWNYDAGGLRCAYRSYMDPNWAASAVGFRCVRGL